MPFPNDDIYRLAIQDSAKAIPNENLFDDFDIHLNIIWRKTIMRQYSYESVYEWQRHQSELRGKFLEFTKECNRLFEYLLEGKNGKNIYPLYQNIIDITKQEKGFPVNKAKCNLEEEFENELKVINDFKFSFRNFMDKLDKIIDFTNTTIPLSNLKKAEDGLVEMQESFKKIQDKTYPYFNMSDIEKEEKIWVERLLKTVVYFIETNGKKAQIAKEAVTQWHDEKEREERDTITSIRQAFVDKTGFMIYHSLNVIEKGSVREFSIAIEGYEEGDLEDVLFGLVDFYMLDIDYVNIIRVQNKEASYAFRIPKLFFEKIQNELDGGEYEESEFGNPLPINITEELLETLNEKITIESSWE